MPIKKMDERTLQLISEYEEKRQKHRAEMGGIAEKCLDIFRAEHLTTHDCETVVDIIEGEIESLKYNAHF